MADVEDHMLTTVDNPYNPFTHYDEWYAYDSMYAHHTPEYLARVVITSFDLSEADQSQAIEQGIEDICDADPFGIYIRVTASNCDKILATLR